jgi:hypothetical protein
MRHELLDNVDNGGFDPIVIAAADLLREAGTA